MQRIDGAGARRLAVVGSPIAHSLSPALHGAAARELGLDWRYERRLVAAGELAGFLDVLDGSWLGLSVTAPLKHEARALAASVDARAELTGAVNTLLLGAAPRGWNTDVGGIVRSFADAGLGPVGSGAIVGAGGTAQAALLALAELGAGTVTVGLRSPAKGARLTELGERLGVTVSLQPLTEPLPAVDAAVSTLPAGAEVVPAFAHPPARLLDADYARPEGSRYLPGLGAERVIDGREMLLGQAVLQARIFALGEIETALPDEARVAAAMRAAMVGSGTAGLEES
ncbi:shikimate dehydrogenase family protein [Agrococcus baldri]|uniref:Shikimate 5-dehydrogenase n=1 Tax=Agrococcus baldri TaxID=153730 RepID=A0AA87RJP8_9MICO|nr:shikimate dehydrogenase [Agrococcus baldri]GEK80538.1 shikimate 5-dehydrogenase [Agrococcus baldri]